MSDKIFQFERGNTVHGKRSKKLVPNASSGERLKVKDVKEAVKKRNLELKKIELNLMSNEAEDWDIALSRVRNLINDKDKIFGRKLI